MKVKGRLGVSSAKVLVLLAIAGAVAFGGFIAYVAWTNDSFPVTQKPFADYAKVTSSTFNGTEYAFDLQWLSSDYLPLFAQLTSTTSDAANSPVCGLGLASVAPGQAIFMPFGITRPSPALTNVELNVAVKSASNGSEFTIVYHVDAVSAQPGKIQPQGLSCEQPPASNI